MVLPQDQAQASQAEAILAERKYQKDLAQYEKDLAKYNKEKEAYDTEQRRIESEKAAETKRIADAKAAEAKRIADAKAAAEKKVADRAAQFKEIEDTYEKNMAANPHTYRAGRKGASYNNRGYEDYIKAQQRGRLEAEKTVRSQHLAEDGWSPIPMVVTPWVQPDLAKHLSQPWRGYSLGANEQYQLAVVMANRSVVEGKSTPAQALASVASAKVTWDSYKQRESDQISKRAQTQAVAQRAADSAHWNQVITNPNTSRSNQTVVNSLGLSHNVQQLDDAGVSTLYNQTDLSQAGSLPSSATVTLNTSSPKAPIIPVRTNTSSNKGVNEANTIQKQYVQDLRDGKVGLAQALLQPRTPQQYSTGNTINLKQFLVERGYDINRPETIPDSVLTTPVKYESARQQASYAQRTDSTMGDLRKLIPAQPQVSQAVLQERQKAMANIAADKGGSFIGYGPDGTPIQGAPFVKQQYQVTTADGKVRTFNSLESAEKFSQRMAVTQYEVNVPTSVPTMYGAITVQEPILFESKEEAQAFIDNRQANLPYTQGAKILPLEQMYSGYDQFAKESYKRAEQHQGKESSWIYEGGAAWTSFGGDMLNLATIGGDLLDKHVFKREVIEKQPITTIPTYYDKGTEKALEGIEITETGITGVPSFNPLNKNNIASKWYQGAAAQWEKQTPAQNIGQSTVAIPLAIVDVVTAAQAGTSIVRRLGPGITKVATKIASTPTIVTKVVEASVSVKPKIKNPSYANYNINSLANPDKIDLNFRGADYMESRAPTLDLNSLANRGIIPKPPKTVKPVEADPYYSNRRKIDLNLKDSPDYMESPKPPVLNLQSEAFQKDLAKQAPKGVGNYGAEQFRKFQESVSPSINVIGRIKLSEGFVPGKPTRSYTPYKPKPVEADPYYSPEKIDLNLKDSPDYMESKAPALNLQSKSFLKEIKKGTPNYERAASDFADFQKSLDPKPQKYSNIVGTIKFSEGFIPNKNPTKVAKKPNTDVKEEPLFKQDKVNKKKIFKDDDKLAGWETKPIEGGQATGSTTVQILKPQTKKPLKTSKKLLQDRQNPTPTARDFTQLESERAVAKSGSSPIKVIPIPRDPTKKKKKKIQTVTTTGTVTSVESGQVLVPKAPQQTVSGVIPKLATSQFSKSKVRQTPKTSNKVVQKPVTMVAQPQKIVAKIKPLQAQRTPTTPRPRTKLKIKPMFRARPRQAQAQPTPRPNRLVAAAAIIDTPKTSKKTTKKTRTRKRKDFLGNTRTYAIVGLFRREEVIYGDKATAKQLKRDKKFKENKKIIRKKKKQTSFGQKIGIISKGFKI